MPSPTIMFGYMFNTAELFVGYWSFLIWFLIWFDFKPYATIQKNLTYVSNVVVHSQAARQRDDWKEKKNSFHRTTILHTIPIREAAEVYCCWRGCFDTNSSTNAPPPSSYFLEEFLSSLIRSLHFSNCSTETKFTYPCWTSQ